MNSYRLVTPIMGAVWACALAGCSPQEEPRRYRAPKEEAPEAAAHHPGGMASAMPPAAAARLAYETPEGWATGELSGGMRKAAFVVQDGERKVEITAIDLNATAGALLPNVNRWRGQIELGEFTQVELDEAVVPIQVAGVEGHYVELLGPEEADPRQAILGVVAIHGQKAWFFKLWGDAELALREKERFRDFVKSVRLDAAPRPHHGGMSSASLPGGLGGSSLEHDEPEGWTPVEVSGMRKAAFTVQEGERKVDITAIDLPAASGALLPNVNRWRKQIELSEFTQEELNEQIIPVDVAGLGGHYVELLGPEDADPRQAILGIVVIQEQKAWFFKLWGDAELALREKERFLDFVQSVRFTTPKHGSPSPPATHGASSESLEYDTPEGWTPGGVGSMRKAAFTVRDGEQNVEISAMDLALEAGALLTNVNRWRRQIQLDEITQDELEDVVSPIQVAGAESHYVELVGPEDAERRRAILAVVAIHDARAWFFNMAGDAELALREKERFQSFVKSVKFAAAAGAENGD